MNPIFKQVADNSTMGPTMGVITVLFMVSFAYWTWWAYAPSNAENMKAASRMPLDEEA